MVKCFISVNMIVNIIYIPIIIYILIHIWGRELNYAIKHLLRIKCMS